MSADSIELTFVRCPSCRSLVPAASSRCKMCGAGLEATAQPDKSEEERKKTGRVRQNTMTRSAQEPPPEREEQAMGFEEASEAYSDDPFDLLDDEDSFDEPMMGSEDTDSADEGLENPLGSYLPEDREAGVNGKKQRSSSPENSKVTIDTLPEEVVAARTQDREVPRQRVTIESGARPQGKPSALSFNRPKAAEQPPIAAARKPEPPRSMPRQQEPRQQEPVFVPQKPAQPKRENQNRPVKAPGGNKLFGWFVSYENPEGSAIELREGRFFISGSQLKANDLVIPDQGLSTPHALVSISLGQSLRMQDLMSEGGLYVKRKDSDKYKKEESTVVLEHGDWIKLGEVEFLLAIISGQKG